MRRGKALPPLLHHALMRQASGDQACTDRSVHSGSNAALSFAFGNGVPADVAASLLASGQKNDAYSETFMVQSVAGCISPALDTANGGKSSGKGSSEDGTGRGVPVIAFSQNTRNELRWESGHGQVAGPLSTGGGKPGQGMPVVLSLALRGRTEGNRAELGAEIAPALRTASGGANKSYVLLPCDTADLDGALGHSSDTDWDQWRVRRLMPVECERLQGIPDHYTLVPYRNKPAADGPRYQAIGNSMAVPCVAWLGQRLLRFL